MATVNGIYHSARSLALAECAPHVLPYRIGRQVRFPRYDNGFNVWPATSATVVLGIALCRNSMGALRLFVNSRKAAEFIHAC